MVTTTQPTPMINVERIRQHEGHILLYTYNKYLPWGPLISHLITMPRQPSSMTAVRRSIRVAICLGIVIGILYVRHMLSVSTGTHPHPEKESLGENILKYECRLFKSRTK